MTPGGNTLVREIIGMASLLSAHPEPFQKHVIDYIVELAAGEEVYPSYLDSRGAIDQGIKMLASEVRTKELEGAVAAFRVLDIRESLLLFAGLTLKVVSTMWRRARRFWRGEHYRGRGMIIACKAAEELRRFFPKQLCRALGVCQHEWRFHRAVT